MEVALPLLGLVEFRCRRHVSTRLPTSGPKRLLLAAGRAQEALLEKAPLMTVPGRSRRCRLAVAGRWCIN